MWKNGSWILHPDNAPAHNAPSVKRFLTKHKITVLEHPPYSPDLFPKIKSSSGRFAWSGVGIREESTLRVTTFP
jgi:hypothetical protein